MDTEPGVLVTLLKLPLPFFTDLILIITELFLFLIVAYVKFGIFIGDRLACYGLFLLFKLIPICRFFGLLDNDVANQFEAMVSPENQDYQGVISFLQQKVPGFSDIVSEEMSRLKRTASGIFA